MRKIMVAMALAGMMSASWAAAPSDASIEELLAATKAQQLVASMLANVEGTLSKQLEQLVAGKQLSDKERKALATLPAELSKILAAELSWAKWKPVYVKIYKETFEQKDVDGLVAFYKSPTGKVAVEKMPLVMQKSMEAMQAGMGPTMEKLRATVMKTMTDAKGPQVAPAPAK